MYFLRFRLFKIDWASVKVQNAILTKLAFCHKWIMNNGKITCAELLFTLSKMANLQMTKETVIFVKSKWRTGLWVFSQRFPSCFLHLILIIIIDI